MNKITENTTLSELRILLKKHNYTVVSLIFENFKWCISMKKFGTNNLTSGKSENLVSAFIEAFNFEKEEAAPRPFFGYKF